MRAHLRQLLLCLSHSEVPRVLRRAPGAAPCPRLTQRLRSRHVGPESTAGCHWCTTEVLCPSARWPTPQTGAIAAHTACRLCMLGAPRKQPTVLRQVESSVDLSIRIAVLDATSTPVCTHSGPLNLILYCESLMLKGRRPRTNNPCTATAQARTLHNSELAVTPSAFRKGFTAALGGDLGHHVVSR